LLGCGFEVPDDALDKVRRRLRPIYQILEGHGLACPADSVASL
jgi:hypothetical protein